MRLIEELERLAAGEESLFRAQLLREDVARLRKLQALAGTVPDGAAFRAAGMRLGWTQGDALTQTLREPLEGLFDAVRALSQDPSRPEHEDRVAEAWRALHRQRMERLVGCLATPVPKPGD
jgi:hypothetical protein